MPKLSSQIKRTDGFVAIMALAVFALLTVYIVIVQIAVVNTAASVKNTRNYYDARDLSDSAVEFLQYELSQHESGYNLELDCDATPSNAFCTKIAALMPTGTDYDVKLDIKGSATTAESFASACPGTGGQCYVVPFPGTGDAGDRCNLYTAFTTDASGNIVKPDPDDLINHSGQIELGTPGYDGAPQIDYACNWNKLEFGSNLTDRAAIPLFHDTGATIVNPFNTSEQLSNAGEEFYLRVRTPCKPCAQELINGQPPEGTRLCNDDVPHPDPTICPASDRYELDDSENDIVIQWQITGTCEDGKECGMVQYGGNVGTSSEITEEIINSTSSSDNFVLDKGFTAIDTSVHPPSPVAIVESFFFDGKLPTMQQPVLSLFLSEKLLTAEGNIVPYLEYQVITDKPIGNPRIRLNAIININGNVFEKTLYKEEGKDLIDFAIQN